MEFGRKIYINFLYIRGFRSDDGASRTLAFRCLIILLRWFFRFIFCS